MPKMTDRLRRRFAVCVVITIGIAAWSSICEARWQVPDHSLRPFRHGLHIRHGLQVDLLFLRKGVQLPSLHSSYPCSVLGHRPCIPYGTYCSIFSRQPCIPDIDYPIGQTLQLTIRQPDGRRASRGKVRGWLVARPEYHPRCIFGIARMLDSAREGCCADRHADNATI